MNSEAPDSIKIKFQDGTVLQTSIFRDYVLIRSESDPMPCGRLGRLIFDHKYKFVDEVIATEVEVCIATNDFFIHYSLLELDRLELSPVVETEPSVHELKIFIDEDHEDWQLIETHTGLLRDQYIEKLLNCNLSVAMTGFLPGFVYLNGLPAELQVPRKSRPSKRTLANTFAIGGKYAGIYSLPSPAGWNCLGQLAESIFAPDQLPPVSMQPGDLVVLKRVEQTGYSNSPSKPIALHQESREEQGTLRFEKPGMLTLIQDQGREGLAQFAIPRSGPMDATSAALANTILGNDESAPVIECHFVAPEIVFESEAAICLTGANMKWRLDGEKVRRNKTAKVHAGSRLTGSAAQTGCRAYIAIHGAIETSRTFGSSACYTPAQFGGNGGAPFSAGERLHWKKAEDAPIDIRLDIDQGVIANQVLTMEPGPEFDWLDATSQKVLVSSDFTVNPVSNRMGARLDGPMMSTQGRQLADSVPLLPGMVQLTPEGQCIVVLQDGQTTGGYPRIGYLNKKTVERLNQTKIGHPFRFRMADE